MKIVDGEVNSGCLVLLPEGEDDMWSLYNLISVGDRVSADTLRKIVRREEEEEDSRAKGVERVRAAVEIRVHKLDYDREGSKLRLSGRITAHGRGAGAGAGRGGGQFHTLEIATGKRLALTKPDSWDPVARDTLARACGRPAAAAHDAMAVLLMQEGLAHLFLVRDERTVVLSRVRCPISRKYGPSSAASYDSCLKRFFKNVVDSVIEKIDFDNTQCVVIASPGFTKNQFYDYLLLAAGGQERSAQLKSVLENKSKLVLASSSSGFKHGLRDVLADPGVARLAKDSRAAREARALRDFHGAMAEDEARACYGPKHVEYAKEMAAVDTLLVTDELFRSSDAGARRRYVGLAESVRESGGRVCIFSSMHPSGEQLAQLSGIAAILRFPLPELDDIEM